MQAESPWFYLVLMPFFALEAWLLSRWIPFHRAQNIRELSLQRVVPLDGLRGILALSVFFIHAAEYHGFYTLGKVPLPAPSSNFYAQLGVFPVTMFFFITGYVFWLKLRKQDSIPLVPFLYARLARLGGAYWVACLLSFLLIACESHFHANISPLKLILKGVSWLTFFGSDHDLNKIPLSYYWLGQAWTLRFEWLFYFSLPFLGWFARRRMRLILLVAGAAILKFALNRIYIPLPHHLYRPVVAYLIAPYFGFLAIAFSVGMAAATIPVSPAIKAWAQSKAAAVLSLLLLAATLLWATPDYIWQESLLLAAPFFCVSMGNTWFGVLASEPIRFLGRISYSFYLLHIVLLGMAISSLSPLIHFAALSPLEFWAFAAVVGALIVPISALSYQYLEFPYLHVRLPLAGQ